MAETSLLQCLHDIAANGDEQAWNGLCDLAGPAMRRAAAAVQQDDFHCDDAVQEALLYVRDHAADCRAGNDAGAKAWLLRVAHSSAVHVLRRHRSRNERDRRAYERQPTPEANSPDESVAEADLHQRLRGELQALPDKHREPLVLHFLGGLDYAAVGEALACSAGAARVRVHRSLKRLQSRLSRIGITAALAMLATELPAAVPTDTQAASTLMPLWRSLLHADHQVVWQLPAAASVGGTLVVAAKLSIVAALCVGIVYSQAQEKTVDMSPGEDPARVELVENEQQAENVIAKLLEQQVDLKVEGASLPEVVDELRKQTGAPITVAAILQRGRTPSITLSANQMNLDNVLSWIASSSNTQWVVTSDEIRIEPILEWFSAQPLGRAFDATPLAEFAAWANDSDLHPSCGFADDVLDAQRSRPITLSAGMNFDETRRSITDQTGLVGLMTDDTVIFSLPDPEHVRPAPLERLLLSQAPEKVRQQLSTRVRFDFRGRSLTESVDLVKRVNNVFVIVSGVEIPAGTMLLSEYADRLQMNWAPENVELGTVWRELLRAWDAYGIWQEESLVICDATAAADYQAAQRDEILGRVLTVAEDEIVVRQWQGRIAVGLELTAYRDKNPFCQLRVERVGGETISCSLMSGGSAPRAGDLVQGKASPRAQ